MKLWASVTYFDIVNYLLYSCSAYTMDQLKCYKSLETYNQFVNGWVRDVVVTKINGFCVHTAKVMHSQRLNDPPLSPWIIIHPEGRVISAHCNCMAGLGEACTHISALRFSIEASVKVRDSKTPTDEKAYWPPTSIKRVQCAPVGSIDFSSAKKKKKVLDCQLVDSPCKERGALELKEVRPPSEEKIQAFLEKLNATGVKSAILAVKAPYNSQFIPETLNGAFPTLFSELFESTLVAKTFKEVKDFSDNVHITLSQAQADHVEQSTRQQSKSKLWFRFRAGRITASKMYSACHSNPAAPAHSLIMLVCYPESSGGFRSAATAWGCTHEEEARAAYVHTMEQLHKNFVLMKVLGSS